MKQSRLLILALILFIFLAPHARAAEKEKKWSDEAELALVDTGGNTNTTSLSAKNRLEYEFTNRITGTWEAAVLYGASESETSAERYASEIRVDYLCTDRLYTAAFAGWEKDRFDGLDNRFYAGPTVGYKFLIGPRHFFKFESGLNVVYEAYTDETEENFVKGRGFGEYRYSFSEKTNFTQTLELLTNVQEMSDYDLRSKTSLLTSISDLLSLKTSYVLDYDNDPPAGTEYTDRFLSVTLVVNF
ncbi:MAG: DUF481 domain-containing protein [Desulfobacterales bacterium]